MPGDPKRFLRNDKTGTFQMHSKEKYQGKNYLGFRIDGALSIFHKMETQHSKAPSKRKRFSSKSGITEHEL